MYTEEYATKNNSPQHAKAPVKSVASFIKASLNSRI